MIILGNILVCYSHYIAHSTHAIYYSNIIFFKFKHCIQLRIIINKNMSQIASCRYACTMVHALNPLVARKLKFLLFMCNRAFCITYFNLCWILMNMHNYYHAYNKHFNLEVCYKTIEFLYTKLYAKYFLFSVMISIQHAVRTKRVLHASTCNSSILHL